MQDSDTQYGARHIGLHFFTTDLWKKARPAFRSVIITLLHKAAHKPGIFNGHAVARGQVVCSLRNLASDCNVSLSTLCACLMSLDAVHFAVQNTVQHLTVITICNFDELQKPHPTTPYTFPYISPDKLYRMGRSKRQNCTESATVLYPLDINQQDITIINIQKIIDEEIPNALPIYNTPERLREYLSDRRKFHAEIVNHILKEVFKEQEDTAYAGTGNAV